MSVEANRTVCACPSPHALTILRRVTARAIRQYSPRVTDCIGFACGPSLGATIERTFGLMIRCWSWRCTDPTLPDVTATPGTESTALGRVRLCCRQPVAGVFTALRWPVTALPRPMAYYVCGATAVRRPATSTTVGSSAVRGRSLTVLNWMTRPTTRSVTNKPITSAGR